MWGLSSAIHCFLRQWLSLAGNIPNRIGWLSREHQGSICLLYPVLGLQVTAPHNSVLKGFWELNTGLHACKEALDQLRYLQLISMFYFCYKIDMSNYIFNHSSNLYNVYFYVYNFKIYSSQNSHLSSLYARECSLGI